MQNQDFTVVQDYITGLKALLWLQANPPPQVGQQGWSGQSPPQVPLQKGKPAPVLVKHSVDLSDDLEGLNGNVTATGSQGPYFGPYLRDRRRADVVNAAIRLDDNLGPEPKLRAPGTVNVNGTDALTPVERLVGRSLPSVGPYNDLDKKAQRVALVNDVRNRSDV